MNRIPPQNLSLLSDGALERIIRQAAKRNHQGIIGVMAEEAAVELTRRKRLRHTLYAEESVDERDSRQLGK